MAKSIKREQEVIVIAGSQKGKRGKVLEVMGNDRVIVEGVNMITKYERKTQENPEGSSIQREALIHYSNVMLTEKFDAKAKSKK